MGFLKKIEDAMDKNNSLVCIGLDPQPELFPKSIQSADDPIFSFNKEIIDYTADVVCAYKPQIAHYHAYGAEDQLYKTITYIKAHYPNIPVILDAKRGDIASTSKFYAMEAFERYKADAVTVNPYMGSDAIKPFTNYKDKGVIVLCRTSNKSASVIQDVMVDGKPLYQFIATLCKDSWNTHKNILLVLGATNPEEIKKARGFLGEMTFLVPGLGAQGGNTKLTIKNGLNSQKKGMIVNASRSILYAKIGADFAQSAQQEAIKLKNSINQWR